MTWYRVVDTASARVPLYLVATARVPHIFPAVVTDEHCAPAWERDEAVRQLAIANTHPDYYFTLIEARQAS